MTSSNPFEDMLARYPQTGSTDNRAPELSPHTPDFTPTPPRSHTPNNWDNEDITVTGGRQRTATSGWRGWLNKIGFNLSRSDAEQQFDTWVRAINQPSGGYPKIVAFTGPKGGVGKTITNIAIGSTIAQQRSAGGVVGVDADESSLLVRRVKSVTGKPQRGKSVATFATDTSLKTDGRPKVHTYLTTNAEGYSVLPGVELSNDEGLTPDGLAASLTTLAHHFDLVLVDLPGAREAKITKAGINMADAMVYVMSTSPDALFLGRRHLEDIAAKRPDLLAHTVVILNHQSARHVGKDELEKTIRDIERLSKTGDGVAVFETGFDQHIAEGGGFSIGLADEATRRDYVKISAAVMDAVDSTTPTRVMTPNLTS